MENPDWRGWITSSFCENPSFYFPMESVPDIMDLVVILEVIAVWWFSTQTVFAGVSPDVPGYESSQMMISAQMRTGKSFVVVCRCVNVAFLNPFFWVPNVGDTLSSRWRILLPCGI